MHPYRSERPLKEVWGTEGLWDAVTMLPGIDPGQSDPYVPPSLAKEGWRSVIDAEGVLLALVPPSTDYEEDGWPEKFVEFLNAAETAAGGS